MLYLHCNKRYQSVHGNQQIPLQSASPCIRKEQPEEEAVPAAPPSIGRICCSFSF